jgi:hypothetical protein
MDLTGASENVAKALDYLHRFDMLPGSNESSTGATPILDANNRLVDAFVGLEKGLCSKQRGDLDRDGVYNLEKE